MRRSPIRSRTVMVLALGLLLPGMLEAAAIRRIEVPIDADGTVALSRIVTALATSTGQTVNPPGADLKLPVRGFSGSLGRSLLEDCLGDDVIVHFTRDAVVFDLPEILERGASAQEWRGRLERLVVRTEEAAGRLASHAMRARPSYRPNDPERPTICLVHGLNSSSEGFVHMIPLLEEAGYGVVTYDYPFNQRLDDSCGNFEADWTTFRRERGEKRPWSIIAHSMGALLARSYVEGAGRNAGDVDSLILIAPVNQGADIARLQPVLQTLSRYSAVQRRRTTDALAELAEGPGRSADDMLPGSPFLQKLNARTRNEAVPYHIIAGSIGLLTAEGRKQIEDQIALVTRNSGPFGVLTKLATGQVSGFLDELTDGTGDGAVTVEATRLPGAPDPVVLEANHAELIRAPVLFADPGPVVTMPWILRWLRDDRVGDPPLRPAPASPAR